MDVTKHPIQVALIATPEATASTLYGMYDLLKAPGRDWALVTTGAPGDSLLAPMVVSADGQPVVAANGVTIVPDGSLADCPDPAVICVPDLFVAPGEALAGRFDAVIGWMRECFERGTMIASACSGALLLGEAGLLRGQDATTHWAYCDAMAQQYPGVRVLERQALVASGDGQRLIMAGGGTTWIDLTLYIISRLVSVDEAMHVARIYMVNWHDFGQQPYARLARASQSGDRLIADAQVWIADNYRQPAPVKAMIERAGIPERSFKRRFAQATGMSPLEYIHTLRLEDAKQLLEASGDSVEAIAVEVGYEDASFFSRLFRRKVGITPAQYRRKFGGMRRALSPGRAAHEVG
ncbi:GlxA family transcriptional regulator [Nitrogeniibacter aestuarii]|uniref:GlxA family transcriptional regulator n=1 Tax=Nitrogeniibacter aestuarii TaxID=2815343 RepID=UPI001E332511|nr:helix-turn-helix domain-containing protein [Nitrogeniibacter aestuarii]